MKNLTVRTNTRSRFPVRLAVIAVFAALLSAASFGTAQAQTSVSLGAAEDFAVLAGTAVTLTGSDIIGDVGVTPGGTVTNTDSTVSGKIDKSAKQAYADFLVAYDDLAAVECTGTLDTAYTNATLTLTPGVYCNSAAVTFTDTTLTLDGSSTDTWIFLIGTGGTGALTGTNFTVEMTSGEACSNNVFWWTAQAATLTDSVFLGSILAGADITVTGGSLDGQALAGGTGTTSVPTGAVTLTNTEVSVCGATGDEPGKDKGDNGHSASKCNQGVGNGPEECDPGNSNQGDPSRSNDELGGTPGEPGRKGGGNPHS